jgi:hypothetical protein
LWKQSQGQKPAAAQIWNTSKEAVSDGFGLIFELYTYPLVNEVLLVCLQGDFLTDATSWHNFQAQFFFVWVR